MYLSYHFVMYSCLDVVEGGIRAHGEEVETRCRVLIAG